MEFLVVNGIKEPVLRDDNGCTVHSAEEFLGADDLLRNEMRAFSWIVHESHTATL